ncbi:hypothetical protein Clopa_3221 [Clostridium pasteurianum BC1]|uniref:Uncharacterized protein n=1 Tax=Clostridium pasteurianum BC1 TaxID=86416 RepID=R4KEK3_CLOPA|nr:hypothetical protein Clopa_3221 [Clostridium pasteurianum BC1]
MLIWTLIHLINAAKRYLIRVEELTSQNEELKQELFLLKQKELDNSNIPIEFIYTALNQFVSNFEKLDISEKREAINKFIEKVEYNSDSMNLHVTFL